MRFYILHIFLFFAVSLYAISPDELADSIHSRLNFPTCVGRTKVRAIQVRNDLAVVRCNRTPGMRAFSQPELDAFLRDVARWTECRRAQVLSDGVDIATQVVNHRPERGIHRGCSPAVVALWPSHGRYLHPNPVVGDRWLWQRALQWCTTEDRLTTEYTTRITDMLRRAGVTVVNPRPDPRTPEGQALGESGFPRWMEAAVYSTGIRTFDAETLRNNPKIKRDADDYKYDLFCRPIWANRLVKEGTDVDLVLAVHTDGYDEPGDSAMVGTLALYTDDKARQYAHLVQRQIVQDMQHTMAPEWPERELRKCGYVETRVPEMPAMIIEIASHKDISDARYLLDPNAMDIFCRAIYKGVVRTLFGYDTPIAPLTPDSVRISRSGLLSWIPTLDPLEPSAAPESYIVTDQDGNTFKTRDTQLQLELIPGVEYRFTVSACNDGGVSRPSVPVGICVVSDRWVQVLNTFTRVTGPEFYFDSLTAGITPGRYGIADSVSYAMIGRQTEYRRSAPWVSNDNNGWGECSIENEDILTVGNTRRYHLEHAAVWRSLGYSYIAAYGVPSEKDMLTDLIAEHDGSAVLSPGEVVTTPFGRFAIATEPNDSVLYCNRADRLGVHNGDVVLGRFRNGRPAIILRGTELIYAFRLEAAADYRTLLRHLIYEQEKKLTPTH